MAPCSKRKTSLARALILLTNILLLTVHANDATTCSVTEDYPTQDPALADMKFERSDGEVFPLVAYVEPSVASFYGGDHSPPSSTKTTPKFRGKMGKFINLSHVSVQLFVKGKTKTQQFVQKVEAFQAIAVTCYPGRIFYFTMQDPNQILINFMIKDDDTNIFVYDPYAWPAARTTDELTPSNRRRYNKWITLLDFNQQYKEFTGRSYLANDLRDPSSHFMWRADYFHQQHWVTSVESHFFGIGIDSPRDVPVTIQHEQQEEVPISIPNSAPLNLTLQVLSCAPRVLEIANFLSTAEIEHIILMGIERGITSTSSNGENMDEIQSTKGPSGTILIERQSSSVVDTIYRRAADLLRVDEVLFRDRVGREDEISRRHGTRSLAEPLQLVHYEKGQRDALRHDFSFYDSQNPRQPGRWATLMIFLNDDMVGGEISFPRWSNAETFHALRIAPETGKAILLYSQLPDGNMDELAQYASRTVREGEKWILNLWVWDPVKES